MRKSVWQGISAGANTAETSGGRERGREHVHHDHTRGQLCGSFPGHRHGAAHAGGGSTQRRPAATERQGDEKFTGEVTGVQVGSGVF